MRVFEPVAGEMAEWPIVQHWKCCVRETGPGVRIPLSPLLLAARQRRSFADGQHAFPGEWPRRFPSAAAYVALTGRPKSGPIQLAAILPRFGLFVKTLIKDLDAWLNEVRPRFDEASDMDLCGTGRAEVRCDYSFSFHVASK